MKEKIDKAIDYIKSNTHKVEWGDIESQDEESIDINDDTTETEFVEQLLEILGDKEMDKFEEMNKFEILDKNVPREDINWLYSGEEYIITKEDIEALLKGNKLYGQINHEYAFTIELGEKENE